jgi:hypothetical protein
MRRRTLIGAAEVIRALMEVRCGGAAERGARTNQGVSFRSMRAKKTMMKKMMIMIRRRIRPSSSSTQGASAAKKWDTQSTNVRGILI